MNPQKLFAIGGQSAHLPSPDDPTRPLCGAQSRHGFTTDPYERVRRDRIRDCTYCRAGERARLGGLPVDEPAVVAAYLAGATLDDIAAEYGIGDRRINSILDAAGVPRRPMGGIRPPRQPAPDDRPTLGPWVREALCGGDPRFMSEHPADLAEAAQLCARCPVRLDCLTAGLAGREWGVWGGTTHDERRALAGAR